jgi:GT2 family glycosyltransferase
VEHPEHRLKDICAIVVNYNSGSRARTCVDSLVTCAEALAPSLRLTTIVVDNASNDESASLLKKSFSSTEEVSLLEPGQNLGFSGAINYAAARSSADAFLILNPDIVVTADAVTSLVECLGKYPQLGLISPTLCNNDGSPQLGFVARSFPTLSSTIAELFFLHRLWPENPWTAAYLLRGDREGSNYLNQNPQRSGVPFWPSGRPFLVDQPAGAAMLVRRNSFEALGGFDTQFWPAWFEDVDFCQRLTARGEFCAILDTARVLHEGGYSLEALPKSAFFAIWYANLSRYWKKHGSRREYILLHLLLPIALLTRAAVYAISGCVSSKTRTQQFSIAGVMARLAFNKR